MEKQKVAHICDMEDFFIFFYALNENCGMRLISHFELIPCKTLILLQTHMHVFWDLSLLSLHIYRQQSLHLLIAQSLLD